MQSPDPAGLAAHWSRIIGTPPSKTAAGEAELRLPNASFRFVRGENEIMSGLTFRVVDVAKVCDAARARGYSVSENQFVVGGVNFHVAS